MTELTLEPEEPAPKKEKQPAAIEQPDAKPQSKTHFYTPIFIGEFFQIAKILFGNLILNVLTLAIYSFWGKTRLRKYVASSIILDGDSLEYLGTGKELFFGFLKVLPILAGLYGAFIYAEHSQNYMLLIPVYIAFLYLFPVAIFAATRYRFSRTSWRGIRGYIEGSAFSYANLAVWRMFLNIITFGLLIPRSTLVLHKHIMDRTYFGNTIATYDLDAGKGLMVSHIVTLILAIPTFFLSRLWYAAAVKRAKMAGITLGDMGFRSTVTGGSLLGLMMVNSLNLMIIPIFAVGALFLFGFDVLGGGLVNADGEPNMSAIMASAGPLFATFLFVFIGFQFAKGMIMHRNLKFACRHVLVTGDLNTSEILQAKNQKTPFSEGLDDALGLDTGLLG